MSRRLMNFSSRPIYLVSFNDGKQNLVLQYPPCYKDISFWISDSFTENNFCEVVRGIAGDLVEEVHTLSFDWLGENATFYRNRISFSAFLYLYEYHHVLQSAFVYSLYYRIHS